MGYEIHITRAEYDIYSEQHPILEEEWMAVAQADPTLSVDTISWYGRRAEDGTIQRLHPVRWIGHPDKIPDSPCLWHDKGKISSKINDDVTVLKMVNIARHLNARVVGDDGERYEEVEGKLHFYEVIEEP